MNAQDRKTVSTIISSMEAIMEAIKEELEAINEEATEESLEGVWHRISEHAIKVETAWSDIQELAEAEQSKFDNMSEGLQEADSGQRIQAAAELLDSAETELDRAGDAFSVGRQSYVDCFGDLIDALGDAISYMEDACGV